MSARDPDPTDLAARARAGRLTRAEQRELERALASDPDVRSAYEVGRDLDRATAVRGGDEALIARAAGAALARVHGGEVRASGRAPARSRAVRSRAGWSRWLAAAALLLGLVSVSGIAAAWWNGLVSLPFLRDHVATAGTPEPSPAARARSRVHRKHVARALPVAPADPQLNGSVPAVLPAVPADESDVPAAAARARKATGVSGAGELFHAANAARRGGDFARAERVYAELIAAHPGADESGLARVSLAQLRLGRGDASGAESEFRRYLDGGGGQLAEEALVGQAQSLARLGRVSAERAAWQRLLARFPNSVYAATARERLAQQQDGAAQR